MELASLLAFAIALAVAAATPGPGVAALVGRALAAGFWPTVPMMFGIVLGDLLYLAAAILGLGLLAATLGGFFFAVRVAGAIYLLYLAWQLWTARGELGFSARGRRDSAPLRTFVLGFWVTLGNPKAMLFYLALLPTLLDLSDVGLAGYAEASVIVVVVLTAVFGVYIGLASRARRFVYSQRRVRLINRSAAVAMTGAAGIILTR